MHASCASEVRRPAASILAVQADPGFRCCRLWRIIRIMHGVAEAMELNYGQEMGRLQLRVQQLETVSGPFGTSAGTRWFETIERWWMLTEG